MPAKIAKFLGWEKADSRELRRHYERSDLGNAERFIDMHGDRVRWCPARKSWLFYDGMRWAWDERGCVVKLAHLTARSIHKDAAVEPDPTKQKEIAKFAVASQNEGRISGMLSQAKPYLAVGMDELDSDPWAFNCLSGTLDLRTGRLESHNPADLITRLAPVEHERAFDAALEQHYRERRDFYSLAKGVPEAIFRAELWPEIRRAFVADEPDAVDFERLAGSTDPY